MRYLLFLLVLTVSAMAQPTINIGGIANAASYEAAPLDANGNPIGNNSVAQGSIFVIFGANMGPASLVQASSLPLGTSLPSSGTSVSITSGGQTFAAFMVYSSAGQVAAILPSNTPVGPANVTVTYNGQTSAAASINVVKTQFGLFTQNAQGNGPGIAQVFSGSAAPVFMGLTTPAHPGDTMVVVGTGLGGITGADNVAPGAVSVGSNVIVTIGGVVASATYAGRAPQFPGEDQINFQLPADVPTGCYVPASVTASGQVSQDIVLSIATAGSSTCVHPFGLSQSALATLDGGGTVNIGVFQVLRAYLALFGGSVEGTGGLFDNVNANGVFQTYNRILVAFGAVSYPVPLNACVVIDQQNTGGGFTVPNFNTIGGTELVADQLLLTMSGPGGSANVLRQDTGGYLGTFIPSILGPGSWTLSGNGGADVGAFSAKITLPSDLNWTNAGNFMTVPRGQLTILWAGGNLTASSVVTVFGNSTVVNVNDPSQNRAKSFYCAAPASDGKFVVPPSVVQQLPSSTTAAGEIAYGTLGITTGGLGTFTAPLTKGTLDAGVIAYGEAYVLSVKFAQ
jgi:uncharacterized protein (TIGR03437 family)